MHTTFYQLRTRGEDIPDMSESKIESLLPSTPIDYVNSYRLLMLMYS